MTMIPAVMQGKDFSVVADLIMTEDWPRLVAEAADRMGGIDVLVNSGGTASDDMVQHVSALLISTLC